MIWLLFRQYWEKLGNLLFQHLVTLFIISLSLSHVANPSLRSRCPLLLKEFNNKKYLKHFKNLETIQQRKFSNLCIALIGLLQKCSANQNAQKSEA